VNPAKLCAANTEWHRAMRICIKAMMDCDGVALLPDWHESKGAKHERDLGLNVDMRVAPLWYWIAYASEQEG
jgi:hypothetical protein